MAATAREDVRQQKAAEKTPAGNDRKRFIQIRLTDAEIGSLDDLAREDQQPTRSAMLRALLIREVERRRLEVKA